MAHNGTRGTFVIRRRPAGRHSTQYMSQYTEPSTQRNRLQDPGPTQVKNLEI